MFFWQIRILRIMELLDIPKYRKFLHQSFPWIGHLGICHYLMLPLIDAARDCRSAFVEFSSGCEAWNANPWVRPFISKNMASLTLKLEKLILSILKYARPNLKIAVFADSDWCNKYFDHRRHFVGSYGILLDGYQDFDLCVNVRVSFSANRSGEIPIMGSNIKIELSFEEIFDGQVFKLHFLACTFQNGQLHTDLFFLEIQTVEALPLTSFDPYDVRRRESGASISESKIATPLVRTSASSFSSEFDSPASPGSPADSDHTLSYLSCPTSPIQRLESGAYISQTETTSPLVRLNATSFPLNLNATSISLNSRNCDDSGVDVSDPDEEGNATPAPLVRQNACTFFSSSCEQPETSVKLKRKVRL